MQKKPLFIITLIAMLVAIIGAFMAISPETPKTSDQEEKGTKNRQRLTLVGLDGKEVAIEDYRGKVVLLNFWASWCPPCVREIPDLVKLHKNYQDKEFVILGVVVENPEAREKVVKKMVKDFSMSYPVLWASKEIIARFGPINAIPRTFILDPNGKIVEDLPGMGDYNTFETLVKKHLKG